METNLPLSNINEVIKSSEEILNLLESCILENLKNSVVKARTLASLLDDNLLSSWIVLELSGLLNKDQFDKLPYTRDVKSSAFHLWAYVHKIQSTEERVNNLVEISNKLDNHYSSWLLQKEIDKINLQTFNMKYEFLDKRSLNDLISSYYKTPKITEDYTRHFYIELYCAELLRHEDSKMILENLRSQLQEYVSNIYKKMLKYKEEDEKFSKGFKHFSANIKKHQVLFAVFTLTLIISLILTIFFGFDFSKAISFFK